MSDLEAPSPTRRRSDPGLQDADPAFVSDFASLVATWGESNPPEAYPSQQLASLTRIGGLARFRTLQSAADVDLLRSTLVAIGGADLSLGRIFEGHVNAIQLVDAYGDDGQRASLQQDLDRGRVFGVWNTDHAEGVRVEPSDDGRWTLRGAKSFATGAGHIDRGLITGVRPDGSRQLVLVDVGADPTRADNSGWRVRGMKGTCSGLFDFDGLNLDASALIGAPGDYQREPMFSAGAWRFTAVQQGGAEALLRHWRNHLVQSGKGDDPIQRLRFGRSVAAVRSAATWVEQAANAAERRADNAIPMVLMTRGIVEDAALAAMEGAARAVGTASFFDGSRIDRITRDLGLYLRQPVPDQARDRAAAAWLGKDCWSEAGWW